MSTVEMKPVIEDSFLQYAGAVLQSRALVDVRDGLKPSARQIFYSMLSHNLIASKPYKKTANAVGMAMAEFYIHGDASCVGVIMHAGQNFSMRYPLVDVKGNAGTLMESGNWAAPRYTESRLSNLSSVLFSDINKDTIKDWRDNYDNSKVYPAVLPSKGFYNMVNGTSGIGIGMASSVPQYNIKDMNNALIKLLWNEDVTFEDIYCAPDFATGGFLLNEEEVKESMKNGTGAACKLRAKIEYDSDERCLIVKEMPFGVYTNTVCGELENILNDPENVLFERFNDLTGQQPLIKIYLKKTANVNKAITYLYKNTSLQSYFGINFTMLENGRFPKIFGWKDMLNAFLTHQKEVYRRGFEFDYNKLNHRLMIVEGIIIALEDIENVINLIKKSATTTEASKALQATYHINEEQAKAILDIKLSRLAHLEVQKFKDEKSSLLAQIEVIANILNNEKLFKKEIEKDLIKIRDTYGDARRTVILNVEKEKDDPIEVKTITLSLTNKNNLFVEESSNLYVQKRGGKGAKFKMDKDEYITNSKTITTSDTVMVFTKNGMCYSTLASDFPIGQKTNIEAHVALSEGEEIKAITAYNKGEVVNVILFTKNGFMKKSLLSEYETKRKSLKALTLEDGDEVVSVLFLNDENVGILSRNGHLLVCETKSLKPLGRVTKGVRSIKLDTNDYVVSAKIVPNNAKFFMTITQKGYGKRVPKDEVQIATRYTKGGIIQTLTEDDSMTNFSVIASDDKTAIITTEKNQLKMALEQVPIHSKKAQGGRLIDVGESKVVTFEVLK